MAVLHVLPHPRAQLPPSIQGPIISLVSIFAIIIALLLFTASSGAVLWFVRYYRARPRSTDMGIILPPAPVGSLPPCSPEEPPAAPPYPGLDVHQPPQYSSGQSPPFLRPVS